MTYAPPPLKDLEAYWKAQGGVALGIVGDTAHNAKGTSYHLGKDKLIAGAYSARTARDKAGLSDAASAIDLGRLKGSLGNLWGFSAWFAGRCRAGAAGYDDVREVIFWDPKTTTVVGWSDLDPKRLIPGYGDASHKTHTHISYYRDSERRDKVAAVRPYFEAPTGGIDMGILWNPTQWADPGLDLYLDAACTVKVTSTTKGGAPLTSLGPAAAQDPNGMDANSYSILVSTSHLATDPTIGNQRAILWAKRSDLPADTLKPPQAWDDSLWALSQDSTGRYPCPAVPDCPDEDELIAARDEEWRDWLLSGSPGDQPG